MVERVAVAPVADDPSAVAAIVARARRRGFRDLVLPVTATVPEPRPDGETVARRDGDRLVAGVGDAPPVPIVTVATPADLTAAITRTPDGGVLAIAWTGDRIIPLENAIAHRARRFHLWTVVRSPREAPAALGALEHGADRVIVEVSSPEEVDALEAFVERAAAPSLAWAQAPLRSVAPAGLGDRVLVDTTSLLRPDEGLLVGSAAAVLFLVVSEAVGSSFSRPRPFRVNAGAAHSYVLLADGTTRYLAELEPGDAVLAASAGGAARSVRVGRVKIERRPMVAVTAADGERRRTVFLQEAETVRLSSGGRPVAVPQLAAGLSVDVVRLPAARHLGTAVEETIEER
ncbi:MAG TPA: 3-dehydroquinate synthase II [Thermoplasmata archaeon]|nr:3-dehydroquinate synthase II [Thermoplasmata archaeon]